MNILVSFTPRKGKLIDILVREIITRNGVAKYTSEEMHASYTTVHSVPICFVAEFVASLYEKYGCDLGYNQLYLL